MSIYKEVDQFVVNSCEKYKSGIISVGELKHNLLNAAQQIVSLEDKNDRCFLQNSEAKIDGNIALYYGSEGVDHLYNMYATKDQLLSELTMKIVENIHEKFSKFTLGESKVVAE
ncbi:hypothetical protein AGMMS49949_04130 [Alphaproteobacteria bacterium]|nr:hypothetical protein AGMMS49949_04130 [Alphaproteobacteria bacterium]GHS96985.1 hypothetical protein AGMMS50296_3560 [Alphaproteobacteria bacterium]